VGGFIEDGARGIIVAGHNGECWNLTVEEMKRLISLAKEAAAGRVPVLCGIEAMTAPEVLRIAESLAAGGAEGIMVEPPYVVTTSTDAELIDRFEQIATGSPVPVLLYNNPRRTQIHINLTVLEKLAEHENIVGIKESTRDFSELTLKVQRVGKALNVFVGPSPLILPGMLIGAKGFISSGPMELLRKDGFRLYESAAAGNIREALDLHFKVTELYKALFGLGTWPAALKAALNLVGRPAGIPRLPVHPLSAGEIENMKAILRGIGVLS
jgi:4-hydroxy-tetrahydrodipicolinate synthase